MSTTAVRPRRLARPRQSTADKMPALENCFERGKQVSPRPWFVDVTKRTQTERLLHHFVGTFLREEQDFRMRKGSPDLSRGLDSVELRKPNIHQDQTWIQFPRPLHRL